MSAFGKKFSSARDAKGLSLDQIAEETRISTRFLRAIEQETFHLLPGGVFNRGFIRTYATQVGLDPDMAVAEYQDLTEETVVEEPSRSTELAPERHIVPVAIGGLIVLIVLFYIFTRDSDVATEAAEPTGATSQTMARPEPAPPVNRAATPQPPPSSPPATATNTFEGVSIQIQVHDATWIAIATDGREVVGGEILSAGTSRRYTAREAIELTVGNAAGLSLRINDREVPSLGRTGQVRVLTITPNNIDRFTGSS